jgi:hypothetical protein
MSLHWLRNSKLPAPSQPRNARRRFPPPWSVEDIGAACVVKDSAGQELGYFYYDEEPGRRDGGQRKKPPATGRAANSVFERFPRFPQKLVIQI